MIGSLSVRTRLTLWNVGVVALVLVVSGIGLRRHVEVQLFADVDRDLADRAGHFAGGFGFGRPGPPFGNGGPRSPGPFPPPPPGEPNRPGPLAPAMRQGPRFGFGGSSSTGAPVAGAALLHPQRFIMCALDARGQDFVTHTAPLDPPAFSRALRGEADFSNIDWEDEPYRLYSCPIWRDGRVSGVVQFGTSLAPTEAAIAQVTQTLWLWIPLALAMSALGGAFLTGRALRPVREITDAAATIEARNLSERLPVHGRDEFSSLAAMLNVMLARLDAAFERQKRFTADASHELRTPLATIKATSSLAQEDQWGAADCQEAMGTIESAADRAHRILQDLMLLARSGSGRMTLSLHAVPLKDVLEDALREVEAGGSRSDEAHAGRASRASVVLLPTDTPLWVWADPAHLTRLFVNLLQNARRHTPPDGRVSISAAPVQDGVAVTVRDTGEGIAPEHLPHLGERFYRADAARSRASGGAGLGLAICRSIAEAHGGHLRIESALGEGTAVTVSLRRATLDDDVSGVG